MMSTSLPPKVARCRSAERWKHYCVKRQDEADLCFSLLAGSCGRVLNEMAGDSCSCTQDKMALVSWFHGFVGW